MLDQIALQTLKTFSKKELKKLDIFFLKEFPKKKETYRLFLYLKRFHPKFQESTLNKVQLMEELYQGYNNKPQKLKNSLNDLEFVLKEFLIWQELQENAFEKEKIALKVFEKRGIRKSYLKSAEFLFENMEEGRGPEFFYNQYYLNQAIYYSAELKEKRNRQNELSKANTFLTKFHIASKLKIIVETKNRERAFSENWSKENLIFKKELSLYEIEEEVYFQLYSNLLKFFEFNSVKTLYSLIQTFKENYECLPQEVQEEFLTYLIVLVPKCNFIPKKERAIESLKLVDFGYSQSKIFRKEDIPPARFFNCILYACNIKWLDWGEKFIKDFGIYLKRSERTELIKLSQALIEFEKGSYELVLEIINSSKFSTPVRNFHSKVLELKVFYELNKGDSNEFINSKCKAFENFIRRKKKKVSKQNFTRSLNFVLFLRRINNWNSTKEVLLKDLKSTFLINEEWLELKLHEKEKAAI